MPHLNELHEKYAGRGLSVLGVTHEAVGVTEKWVKENEVAYAFAYDKGGALQRDLGVTGIPHAFLIDASGRIVWEGGPTQLTDEMIEKALVGTLPTPIFDLPAEASAVRGALQKRQFAKAIEAAEGVAEPQGLAASLRAIVTARVEALRAAKSEGDFLTASEAAKELAKDLKGLPEEDEVAKIAKEIGADAEAKRVIKAQQAVRKLKETEVRRKKDAQEVIKQLDKVIEKFAGTAAAREAERFRTQLEGMLERLQ